MNIYLYWLILDDIESIEFLHFITVTTIENTECSDIYEDVVILEEMVCASAGTDPFKSPCPVSANSFLLK